MTTYKEFLKLYAEKSRELRDIRVCVICGEKDSSFIDGSNPLDISFLCHTHWRERDKIKDMESRETLARHT